MKKVLHVGSGGVHIINTHGFDQNEWEEVRLDINPAMGPDIVGTMTDLSAVASCSVDAVFSSHNLEHLFAHEVPKALSEFWRVLKETGYVLIITPDIKPVAELVAKGKLLEPAYQSSAGPISALDMMYGHGASIEQGNTFMAHKTAFTGKTLAQACRKAGFKTVYHDTIGFSLFCVASVQQRNKFNIKALYHTHF